MPTTVAQAGKVPPRFLRSPAIFTALVSIPRLIFMFCLRQDVALLLVSGVPLLPWNGNSHIHHRDTLLISAPEIQP